MKAPSPAVPLPGWSSGLKPSPGAAQRRLGRRFGIHGHCIKGALLLAAIVLAACVIPSMAVADFPTAGEAPGTTTGDGTRPFTGLADPPRAAAFTGAAVTSIPIEVPPGRGAATPKLELRYASSQGASAYGHGWSLPIARVVRSTRHGVPRYDMADTFVLETAGGSTELVPVSGSKRFVAKVEGAFARIGFDPDRNTWRVVDKSGTILQLGASADQRIGPDPARTEGTYAWLLSRSMDAAGNIIDYSYESPESGETSGPGLPAEIAYGGNLRAGVPHLFFVRFLWTPLTYPSIATLSYDAGFPQRRDRLLLALETYAGPQIVRRYALSHDQDPASGAVRLVGVSLDGFGADTSTDVALPSTVFTYSDSVVTGWPVGTQAVRELFADSFTSPGAVHDVGSVVRFDTFDINGDGLVDWVDTRPTQPVVRLGNTVAFAAATTWAWPAAARKLREVSTDTGNLEVNVFDLDGDGLPDLVDGRVDTCRRGYWCVYRNTGSGFATSPALWWTPHNPLRESNDTGDRVRVDTADLNGDGRPDWVDATTYTNSSPYWTVHWNSGDGFSQQAYRFRAPRDHISLTRDLGMRKHLVYGLFDMNGDGLPDFVNAEVTAYIPPGHKPYWEVYLNTGTGFAIAPVEWSIEGPSLFDLPHNLNETDSGDSWSSTFMDLVDMNGDGRPDWVRHATWLNGVEPPACTQTPECTETGTLLPPSCCINLWVFINTGTSFSPPVGWAAWDDLKLRSYSDSPSSTEREFEMLDFDGDGLIDLVELSGGRWRIFRHPASPQARWSPIPPERRGAPDLLRSMLNGVGGETHIEYAAAATMRDNRIPFPYWAVTARRIRDGISDAPAAFSQYLYRSGLWAGDARELRGFRDVWETDGTGLTTATRFHQDARLQGSVAEIKLLGPESCSGFDPMDVADPCSPLHDTMRVDTNTWSTSGAVLLVSRTSTPYARNAPVAELGKRSDYIYDDYGNVTTETIASPSAATVVSETRYAYTVVDGADGMPERYLVDRPTHTVARSLGAGARVLAEKSFVYDSATPLTGLLAESGACIEWNVAVCARWKTSSYRHDRAGNVTVVTGPTGAITQTVYDKHLLYAHATRNAAGHVTESTRDLRNGRETLKRLPNGRVFETDYDGLGRPVRSWNTGFSPSYPEVTTTYVDGVPGGALGYVRTRQVGVAPVVVFFDGLGRRVAIKTLSETAAGEQVIVSGRALYDAAGRLGAEGVTFASSEPILEKLVPSDAIAPAWTRHLYDDHGRPRQTILPDGSRTLYDVRLPGVRVTVFANLAGGVDPGKAEIELRDGFDRVWRKDVCSAAPPAADPTACPPGTLLERVEVDYDGLDRPLRITSASHTANPAVTEIDYDGLGNRVRFESSDLGRWSYEYGADGLLTRATDPRGFVMLNSYDKIGRLRAQSADGFKARYSYQRQGGGTGLVRRIRSQNGTGQVRKDFVYDERGRVAHETIAVRAGGPPLRQAITYEYDTADRRIATSYPTSDDDEPRRVVTTFSRYGRPTSLTAFDGDARTEIVSDVAYDLLGNMRSIRFPNGLTDVFVHDTAARLGRLQCIRTTRNASATTTCSPDSSDVRRISIASRDTAGNILSLADGLHVTGSALSDTQLFTYDSLGRLSQVTREAQPPQHFAYDAHGNVAMFDGVAFVYSATAPHRPTLGTEDFIEHDAAGNRTRKGLWTYTYDALGRLSEARYAGALREAAFYDESHTRVTRFDAVSGSLRYYVGGLFEVESGKLTRHYWLGGHLVASDVVDAPASLRRGIVTATASVVPEAEPPAARRSLAEAATGTKRTCEANLPRGLTVSHARTTEIALLVALTLFLAASTLGTARSGVAIVTALAFLVATTPLPAAAGTPPRLVARAAATTGTTLQTLFYHSDHVGSPYLVSDGSGVVVEQRRYDAYGRVRVMFDDRGLVKTASQSDVGYTGQASDTATGLVYFGSRYYDPQLGLFLTPDPQAQFASPYLYGGGNPVNGNDADGEFFGFLLALLTPILAAASASALASGVTAALQGGDFLKAFAAGFAMGASGAALGTALGGLNVAYQMAAGGSSFVEASEAMRAVGEVVARSSFTSAVTNAALAVGDAAGLSSDWLSTIAAITPLIASTVYDQYIVKDSGAGDRGRTSQRMLARDGVQQVNTTIGHTNVTAQAAQGTGWERYSGELVAHNLEQDAPAASGSSLRDFVGSTRAVLANQDHFGRLPASIRGIEASVDAVMRTLPAIAPASDPTQPFRAAVGAATHYVQDHLTLGHMVPGTSMFGGPVGAPIRFAIHQAFGGEIAFRDAQIRATRGLLQRYPVLT